MKKKDSVETFNKYENLYGKWVSLNDRFETELLWTEETAIRNRGRWVPIEINKK